MKTPTSRFLPVEYDLVETIRLWRNQPRVRQNMLDDTIIDSQQQKQWFENLSKNKNKIYKVFYQNWKPVGMLYFSDINTESCSWGCYIGEEAVWLGTGMLLSIAALDYAFNDLNIKKLNAEVLESNISPIIMHQALEYTINPDKPDTTRSGKKINLKCFSYEKQDWIKNRESILNKLPIKISQATDLISFE